MFAIVLAVYTTTVVGGGLYWVVRDLILDLTCPRLTNPMQRLHTHDIR